MTANKGLIWRGALREQITTQLLEQLVLIQLDKRNSLSVIYGKHIKILLFCEVLVQKFHFVFVRIQLKIEALIVKLELLALFARLLVSTQVKRVPLRKLPRLPQVP